jgi:VanZ family protein
MLVIYWVALFVAMHVRLSPPPVGVPNADKLVHFAGYGGLGLLFSLWRAVRHPWTWQRAAAVLGSIAAYGVVDELLQIPVGRDCDPLDWLADITGALGGILVFSAIERLRPR